MAGLDGRLPGTLAEPGAGPALVVLANHGSVQRNARGGRPLSPGKAGFRGGSSRSGLYCHAPSRILVRLPGPGRRLSAVLGVDSNQQTSGGRGSVVFSVSLGDREAFRSPVLREGMAPVPISVDLGGRTELTLEVGDAGDGIACDQADWAEARVILEDGAEVRLADLPLLGAGRSAPDAEPPFSFVYGGSPSGELLGAWAMERARRRIDAERIEHTLTWTDPATGLVVRLDAVEHEGFPTVEWTVRFRNSGAADSPLIEDIRSMDVRLEHALGGRFLLHHNRGDSCSLTSFEPLETELPPGARVSFAPAGGRPTNGAWPYFNVEGSSEGVIAVVGWPGQWAATFERDEGSGLRILAGQERTRFRLRPGEEVRSPLSLLQFWAGDWIRAQNVWRRFVLERVFPLPGGRPLAPALAGCSGWHFPGLRCNQAGEIRFIDRYLEEGIRLDWWWMDAGWYPCGEAGWPKVGTWEVDRERYPGGIRAVTDHARSRGIRSILWFEPERVAAGTWLSESRPAWIHGGSAGGLLDLGNREAREWIADRVDRVLREEGIDLYREDFNMDPLGAWRAADAPDRQGIAEIRHVEGHLALWDEIRRRHPGLLIDSCASGGRRDDLESMRRAVPLLITDFQFHPVGSQCHTYGFDLWLPYHSSGNRDIDAYAFRSDMAPMMGLVWDVRRGDLDYALARRLIAEWRMVAPCFLGDRYPLTPYSASEEAWMAWQLDLPESGEGAVQAFRRSASVYESARFPLRGLDPEARYRVIELSAADLSAEDLSDLAPDPRGPIPDLQERALDPSETGRAAEVPGRDLIERGILVSIPERPGAAVLHYRNLTPRGKEPGR